MQDSLRARMGWLHGWLGFMVGLILVCIFMTGTLAVFDREFTQWMEPEISPDVPAFDPISLDKLRPALLALQQKGENPVLDLPSTRDPYLRLIHFDGMEFVEDTFNPSTGLPLHARQTAGGTFFFDLHANMRYGVTGVMVIMLAGLCLLVILLSGIIIHMRKIFTDLLLVRPFAPRLRAWTDVHVLAGVPFLPFAIFMAYSGTVIHSRAILPAVSYTSCISALFEPAKPQKPTQPPELPKPKNRHAPLKNPPPPLTSLTQIFKDASHTLGEGQAGRLLFNNKKIFVTRRDSSGPELTEEYVTFDRIDGHFLSYVSHTGIVARTNQIMRGLHFARWAGTEMRWLYFMAGLSGVVMMGSGLVLFLIKRRETSKNLLMFRLGEGLAIATLTGLPLAVLSYLWANRILPETLPARAIAEAHIFGAVWGMAALCGLCFSLFRRSVVAWKINIWAFAIMGAGILPLDILTRPSFTPFHTPTAFAAVDMIALLLAFLSFQGARRL